MATTERHKVPETILSRCQLFEFRTIATAKIMERLKLIAKEEKIAIPDDALREIARTGAGSMRDAQSALDQVISFAGDKIKKEDVEMALGIAGADTLKRIIYSIANYKPAEAIATVDDVVMRGHDLRNFCRDLLAHLRDLLVTKVSGNEELLEAAVCEPAELKQQAELFSESDLVRFFHSLAETETKLRAATQPRYQLEVGIVKLMELRGVESISEIIQRLSALEANLGGEPSPASSRTPSGSGGSSTSSRGNPERPPTSSRPAGSSFTAAAAVSPAREKEEPEPALPPIAGSTIDRVKSALENQRKMLLVTALDAAQTAVLEESELFVEFAPDARVHRDTLSRLENIKLVQEACRQVTGKEIGVRISVKDPTANDEPLTREDEERLEKQRLRELAENSPIVQQMMKTFRGEIVDVRRDK
jgi:DNA polymerase-3 subunit gamma/tau